ncbi:class III lanthionine synthetase LanKC [Nocardiopsis rhodophaea]|uniref:non-specific serine/threonine protein kinase n=1 Tax=Nocardiopsis rhodophaea TaxID=280238 RepID=A0ABP5F0Y4_9ACTN
MLDLTSDYCVSAGISFKHLAHEGAFLARNAKYADRAASGKFITIYPPSDDALYAVLNDLAERLDGLGGPYILSDLRWKDSPLYVRYGAFTLRYVRNERGEPVPAIEDPQGRLCPDRREPVFSFPDWVRPPDFLLPLLKERSASGPPADFPFTIRSALHFSNGGGIYLADDRESGATVVLKEARPHAALDQDGRDAIARLRHEHDILTQLADVDAVVGLRGRFTAWEHEFLVQEYVGGGTLSTEMARRNPLARPDPDGAAKADFTRWVVDVTSQVERAIDQLHDRGIAFGDLHPGNVLLRGDGRIALADLEVATRGGEDGHIGIGAPAFTPPDRRGAYAADRYALGCVKIAPFLPLTMLCALDTGKARTLVDAVEALFPVPDNWGRDVLDDLDLGPSPWAGTPHQMARSTALIAGAEDQPPGPGDDRRSAATKRPDWRAIEDSIARAIQQSATPERTDRLFPGDVEQFTTSGLGLAHGAAGVLYALSASGHGRHAGPEQWERWEGWLLRRVREQRAPHRLGFYDGLHGIAYALEEIGLRDEALETLEEAARGEEHGALADGLYGGRSGIALNQLHFFRRLGDREFLDAAVNHAQRIADGVARPEERGARGPAGLLRGPSGSALLFLHLYREADDRGYLDLAQQALEHDLRSCVHVERDDTLLVDDGQRTLPYVADGSAGIGLVLDEFLRHRDHPDFTTALARIRRAAQPELAVFPMLFQGSAGLLGLLTHLRRPDKHDARLEELIAGKRDRLRWHMLGLRGEIAFPGDQLLRLSMDLATGSAGILLALAAVRDDDLPILPFLTRATAAR